MTDIGYYAQIQPGINGNPDNFQSPEQIAALQEQYAQMAIARTTESGYVPPGLGYGACAPEWATQAGGPSNLPIIGWTCQNSTGPAFVEQPGSWTAEDMGRIPDWTADANSAGAGSYDQTQVVAYGDNNPLNVAPIGDGLLQYDDAPTNPNFFPEDQGGQIGRLEY